jgi:transcriptional regulator with XRE-family HTH domain
MEHWVVRSRVLIGAIIVGSVFMLTAGAALAAGSASVTPSRVDEANDGLGGVSSPYVTSSISGTEHLTGSQMIAGCIAAFFDVPMTDVVTLRSDGYGFGEVAAAYFLARDNGLGLTVTDTLDLRASGMGWGEIAKYLGLPPSRRDRNLGQIISGHLPISGTVSVAAQRLAERLGTTPEAVQDLLGDGVGYGTIVVAYKLAGELGVTPEELVEKRLAGAGWGQIRRELSSTASTTAESQEGPPENAGPPDHAGAPEDKGPPDHGGPKDQPGPPDHAGPKDHNEHSK